MTKFTNEQLIEYAKGCIEYAEKFQDTEVAQQEKALFEIALERLTAPVEPEVPDGYALVPVEPTEDMVIHGFDSVPHPLFQPADWDKYQTMSGCEQAAHRAKLCWAAMIAAAPDFREIRDSSTNNCRENAETSTNEWIPCSERMPEKMVSVLATGNWFDYAVTAWDGGEWLDFDDYEPPVTHWMPLPKQPQQNSDS